jgi:hypothetical protein
MKYALLTALLLAPVGLSAQSPAGAQKPDNPRPKTVNTEFRLQVVAMGASWLTDTITTQRAFEHCSGCVEGGLLFTGSRNTAKIMGSWALVDIGAVVVSYEFKRHVHNRVLNQFWRAPILFRTASHAQAAQVGSQF